MSTDTLRLTRTFRAPPEKIFEAFVRPEVLMRWFGPRGCTCPAVTLDVRPGGRYRIEMHGDDSGDVMVISGEYHEVVPNRKLVFTWVWAQGEMAGVESRVAITLAPKPGGTELSLVHSGLPTPRALESHALGWQGGWECLDDALAGKPKTAVAQPVLLGDPRSTYTRSVRMALAEKGIAYRLQACGPTDEAVGAIHPFQRIPAYRQGPLQLFESSAIMRYADDVFPGPKLVPETPAERAQMEQWISAISSYMYDAMVRRYVLQVLFPRGEGGRPDRAVIDKALPEIDYQLDQLERAYGQRNHLVGDRLSLADLLLAPIVTYLNALPESMALLARHPNVLRGFGVMAERPSFAATMPPT